MPMAVVLLLLPLGAGGAPTLEDVQIRVPEGWPTWARAQRQAVYQAPEPEVEEAMLSFSSASSVDLRHTLAGQIREATRGRKVVRISPPHEGITADGLAWVARVVISENETGQERHTFVAAVQGVRRAVVVHFETGYAESLSRHFVALQETVARIQFRE